MWSLHVLPVISWVFSARMLNQKACMSGWFEFLYFYTAYAAHRRAYESVCVWWFVCMWPCRHILYRGWDLVNFCLCFSLFFSLFFSALIWKFYSGISEKLCAQLLVQGTSALLCDGSVTVIMYSVLKLRSWHFKSWCFQEIACVKCEFASTAVTKQRPVLAWPLCSDDGHTS